ncbi:hypothetical protein PGQ11_013407 [Apiospora arundinis]|uniref:Uncharacterized protein n=1 Tax=Apiospora arundinis TaxID=335852 RepID=A0ABR2HPS3_9PEZI
MPRHRKESYTLLQRLASYFRWHKCPDKSRNILEGRHDVEVEKSFVRLSSDRNTATDNASILATFDSDCDENLISRDLVAKMMGPGIMLRPGGSGFVSIEFNIVGQRQRFETSHRIADIPRSEKIIFSRCRRRENDTELSPLELHILHKDALSDHCTCCTGEVCQLGNRDNSRSYSWYMPVLEFDQCPSPLAGVQASESVFNESQPRSEGNQDEDKARNDRYKNFLKLGGSRETNVLPDTEEHDSSEIPSSDCMVDKDLNLGSPSATRQLQTPDNPSEETRGHKTEGDKSVVESNELPTQLKQGMREYDPPRLQQHSFIRADHNKQPSSYGSGPLSLPATSVSSTQLSTSPGQAALTNSTSLHSHEDVAIRDEWQARQTDAALRVEVPEQRERLQGRRDYTSEQEYSPSQQYEYVLSASAQLCQSPGGQDTVGPAIGVGGAPRISAEDTSPLRKSDYGEYSDEDGGDTYEVNEEEYPDLPFPDDYWTYDAEAKNYYHTDREEDGRETKIWYPLEFL